MISTVAEGMEKTLPDGIEHIRRPLINTIGDIDRSYRNSTLPELLSEGREEGADDIHKGCGAQLIRGVTRKHVKNE
ncbi:MAG TPA: hypothetical protein VE954_11495 [Oligoflexus sp.]|uniref:hypothetical protein n=1 Tax=Oligoflexus sp. TaxID=1971216 RepID=UPI002D4A4996|nr:hypothetical protein [Oligoflexus sp.]HYX33728.1 hypothetical protein [Oligoflexus sp.]